MNRVSLHTLLAHNYIEQILKSNEAKAETELLEILSKAEIAVHEIEQLYGSGENSRVVKWRGMLELAKEKIGKGDKNLAIRQIYAANEQLKQQITEHNKLEEELLESIIEAETPMKEIPMFNPQELKALS